MRCAVAATLLGLAFGCAMADSAHGQPPEPPSEFEAIRFENNPIIRPGMAGLTGSAGANINGPSLIRVPDWIDKPLGKYYLYFAHHSGDRIRLAYADDLAGPWKVHPGGVLRLDQAPGGGHIASPDVHVDAEQKRIRMYFHQPPPKDGQARRGQVSFVALSRDGLNFQASKEVLGWFYFRVFEYGNAHYALAKVGNGDSMIYRSRDGLSGFEPGPSMLANARHTAVWREGDTLHIVYSRGGDRPERLLIATMELRGDWKRWKPGEPKLLLEPETKYEGVELPLAKSDWGAINRPARQLRDPAIFEEAGRRYLLYSVAGEQGIAIAEMKRRPTTQPAPSPADVQGDPPGR